ncbi:MAG: SRPBCC family protein [Actinomycetota bacterium]
MSLFEVVVRIDAPTSRVWSVLKDWEGSSRWMVDATSVDVLTREKEGVGVRVRAVTRIAGFPLIDEMTTTAWEPERLIQVMHHRAPIKGLAWFAISPLGAQATRFEWGENLEPPLGALGLLGARVLKAPIESVLRRSALKLKRICERS